MTYSIWNTDLGVDDEICVQELRYNFHSILQKKGIKVEVLNVGLLIIPQAPVDLLYHPLKQQSI